MLLYRSIICLLYNSSWIFIWYFRQEMAICSNYVIAGFCMSWILNSIYFDRVICIYVSIRSIVSRENDNRLKFCIWILNWKMDYMDIASRLSYIRIHTYIYSTLFPSDIKKNTIFRTCSFIFCCISNSPNMRSVSWISKIQLLQK